MGGPDSSRNPIDALAEEFVGRYRRGERPPLSEYIQTHPQWADEIRELFPALVMMEQLKPTPGELTGPDPDRCAAGPMPEGLGEYRIIREVGRGGMGVVYEAVQESLGRHVALKVLPPGLLDGARLERFQREARAAARLHHTNVVPVYGVGEDRGTHFIVMQFIDGQPLDKVLDHLVRAGTQRSPASDETASLSGTGRTHWRGVAHLGAQAAEALHYAHGQGVLHRDVKPSNLLLGPDGTLWVTDFGLAKEADSGTLTGTGEVVGTLRYIPPERFRGVSDARGDVYALGLTLYELLTLRPAFDAADRVRLVEQILHVEPPLPHKVKPDVPRDLETVVLKAIQREPAHRYQTARELADDLRRFLDDRPIRARRTGPLERLGRWCRRNPALAALAASVILLLAVVAVVSTAWAVSLTGQLEQTQQEQRNSRERLAHTLLAQARSGRMSGQIGQRLDSLKAVRDALAIARELGLPAQFVEELRNEAIAALAIPDAEVIREWDGCDDDTTHVSFDASLQRYARLNQKGEIDVFRLTADGVEKVLRVPATGRPPYAALRMSPDGRFVAVAHSQTEQRWSLLRVWRVDGPEPAPVLDEPDGLVNLAFTFRPDGRRLAVAHGQRNLSVYDLETRRRCLRQELPWAPQLLSYHPRDNRLILAGGTYMVLCDDDTGLVGKSTPLPIPSISGLACHPDGRRLALASSDGQLRVYDTVNGYAPMTTRYGVGDFNYAIELTFNRAGDRLVVAEPGGQTRLLEAGSGRLMLTLPGDTHVTFGPDDRLLGYQRSGAKLRLWRLVPGRELRVLTPRFPQLMTRHFTPVVDPEGRLVAASSGGWLRFFDLASGEEAILTERTHQSGPIGYSPDGWLTVGGGHVLQWPSSPDPQDPRRWLIGPPRSVLATNLQGGGVSRDGRVIAWPLSQVPPHEVRVFEPGQPKVRCRFQLPQGLRGCAVSPDGRWVVPCCHPGDGAPETAAVWDGHTGRRVHVLPVEEAKRAAFSPNGRWLATGTEHQGCQLWAAGDWKLTHRFPRASFAFSPDSELLAFDDELGVVRLVRTATGQEVLRLAGPEPNRYEPGCFTPDGAQLIATDAATGSLYVWDLRMIRQGVRSLDLDWEGPEYPPAVESPPLTVRLDNTLPR